MFTVIFEVVPKQEHWDDYLDLAKLLKPEIEKIEGFIDNERFASQRTKGRVLSLSTWRDEKSVIRWRTLAVHHKVQEKGRFEVFKDYHLRVGEIAADNQVPAGQTLRQQRLDETEVGAAKYVTVSEVPPHDGNPATTDLPRDLALPAAGTQGLLDQRPTKASTLPASCCCSDHGATQRRQRSGGRVTCDNPRFGTGW